MKKTITLFFLFITFVMFPQSTDYKLAPLKKSSNYFEVVNQMRQELAPLKTSTLKSDIKKIKQFERWAFYWKDRVDLQGNFPSELLGFYNAGLLKADGTLNLSLNTLSRSTQSSQLWSNIGPQTVPDANGYSNAPQMGRLTSYKKFNKVPEAQSVLFVTAPVGGIWKSTDNGSTWSPKLDQLAAIGVTDLDGSSNDANNPGTIYVSTGDYDADHIKSIGVLKSTDFGETYQSTGLSFTLDEQETTSNLIVIDDNTVIVGTNQFIKKTTDGGATWTNTYTHAYTDAAIGKFHRNGSNIIACDSWGGILFSSDNGENWIQLIVEGNSFTRHASTSDAATGIFYIQNEAGQVFTYNPADASPTLTSLGVPTTGYNAQGTYNQALAVKNGLIVSGGVDAINSDDNGGFWYTTLNNAWEDNSSAGSYGHADIHEMGAETGSNYDFWAVNDGGLIYFSYSGISEEKPTVNYISDGVIVTQIYSVAISPQSEDHKIIGNQDNDGYSLEMKDGSLQWVSALAGDGTCTAIDYTNPQIRYLGSQNGNLSRTDIGFPSYDSATFLNTPSTGAPFVWTLKMNTTIPTTLYGGFAEVYKTTDKGATWSNLNSGAGQISYIETFGNNLMVIGENGARKSSNDGVAWSSISEPEASAKLNSLSVNQNNNNIIYATVNGYVDGSKVFKSIDGGSSWVNISAGLPNVKMTQVVFKQNQGSNEILFAGTEVGAYYKTGSGNWEKLGQGLPNVNISDIEINYTVDKLVAATYGRGLWEISIDNNTLGVNEIATTDDLTPVIFPNPAVDNVLNIKLQNVSTSFDYIMYNVVGGVVSKGELNPGLNTIDLNRIASGVYVLRMTSGNYVSTQKVIVKN
ncbi:T9SS type A sorting domain-containing protein [Psychroserpens sp. Hel_I_66]|uniref:T9SS type A sorting domain-containing protein n=1 Tax=Psychroserpens sp. Hel_I_66 TaxID=1250004 RepID=UPI0006477644|nr:T9SS type A sorting domain-containing protein [Psychroserpens sp. Hel_I_66]